MFALGSAVQYLIIANLVGYLLELVAPYLISGAGNILLPWGGYLHLSLIPYEVVEKGAVWQLVTHMFLHAPLPNFWHIFFNMFALWMFGNTLERIWGFRRFMIYYFVTGIGAGLLTVIVSYLSVMMGGSQIELLIPSIGASGAIYGLLLAFAMIFPEQPILVFFLPMPAKYAVIVMGALAFVAGITGAMQGVGHFAHLGGLLIGFLFLRWKGWGIRH
jgi:membrane associated rhomboid family serine protease